MIIRLNGGLGNQMFQYAMARAQIEKNGGKLILDTNNYKYDKLRKPELDKYNISFTKVDDHFIELWNIIWRIYLKSNFNRGIERLLRIQRERKEFYFQDNNGKVYLDGYWQNIKYFEDIHDVLVHDFKYIGELSKIQKEIVRNIKKENSVAMHVRRKDYLTGSAAVGLYANLGKGYYETARAYLNKKISEFKIYIFSDDIEWCKKEFYDWEDTFFVDERISDSQYVDLELMKCCKNFILANSTFSWWASWLAEFEGKIVIAPKHWFRDERLNADLQQALLSGAILL